MSEIEPKESHTKPHQPRRLRFVTFVLLLALAVAVVIGGIEGLRRFTASREATRNAQGSGSTTQRASDPFPRQLLDGSGKTVTIKARPQRIVSQTLATDEILLTVCEPERIIAFSKFALDPEYSNVADFVRQRHAKQVESTEDIVTLSPDLIFIASYSRAEIAEQLQTVGAPVFRFASFASIDDIKKNIRSVGYATGDDERAAAVVKEMDRRLEISRSRIPRGGKPPRVLSFGVSGSTAGSGTLFDDMLRTVGAINVASERGLTGFQRISAEKITEWQPDFIITGSAPTTVDDTRRRLLANPAVAASNAARANHIIIMDNQLFLALTHRITDTVDALIGDLYGKPSANVR